MSPTPELLETSQCLCMASRRAARAITRKFDRALKGSGLRATQFTLLAALALKGPQPIGRLADFIGVERTTLTRNLAVAEKDGLVATRSGKDARSHIASITARGRRTLEKAFAAWRETQDDLTQTIGTVAADSLRQLSREPAVRNALMENTR
jgi:DNA-binding MarR family transcriptional regulator